MRERKSKPSDDKVIELTLSAVENKHFSTVLDQLNKDQLQDLIRPLVKCLGKFKIVLGKDTKPIYASILNQTLSLTSFSQLRKHELNNFYISFAQTAQNIRNVAAFYPDLYEAWTYLIMRPYVSVTELSDIIHRDIIIRRGYSWDAMDFTESLFANVTISRDSRYFLRENSSFRFSLYPSVRRIMANLFIGDHCLDAITLETLPEDETLAIENFENNIPSDLLFLSALAMTGSPLSSNGSLTAAKLKALKKSFKTDNFPSTNDNWQLDRVELLVNAFFSRNDNTEKSTDPGEFARFILDDSWKSISGTRFNAFFPALKGFTRAWAGESYIALITEAIIKLLTPAANCWMSLENLRIRYMCCDTPRWSEYSVLTLFSQSAIYKSTLQFKDEDLRVYHGEAAKRISTFDDIDFPFLLHWIKFLCATGIIEIASDPKTDDNDSLEGMRYARLTPLGRYAFRIEDSYTPVSDTDNCDIEFDGRNGIVTVEDANSPFRFFLEQIAQPIGTTRFHITPETLLKSCSNRRELDEKIEGLRRILDIDKTEALKAIIDAAVQRTQCASRMTNNYTILKLRPNLGGLAKFINSDKEIRENTVLAENNIILVKTAFLDRFRAKCRSKAYLID